MKASHQSAGYVDDALKSPRMDCDDQCSNCRYFVARDRNSDCMKVESPINPWGICEWYHEVPEIYVKDRD